MTEAEIPGYRYGDPALEPSPVGEAELAELKATLLWSDNDDVALRRAGEVLAPRADEVVGVWYDFVASQPHLVAHFSDPQGAPIPDYLDRVRARFRRWIVDTCTRPYDAGWLDYQHEIARRHTAAAKNATDGVSSTAQVPMRHLVALIYPVTATVRPFLVESDRSAQQVDAMLQAWTKAVTLHVALWCRPYAADGW